MKYSFTSKALHWIMSVMIIIMLCIGYTLDSIKDNKFFWINLHKSVGLLILILLLIRIIVRLSSKYPTLPKNTPAIIVTVSKLNIGGLYLLMLIMPISGLLTSIFYGYNVSFFGLFEIASFGKYYSAANTTNLIHQISSYCLVILICVHICGGLMHHFIFKDNVLKRMI